MYDHFVGEIKTLTPSLAVIRCAGVGYALKISLNTYGPTKAALEQTSLVDPISNREFLVTPKITLHAHLAVSEISQVLYGFWDSREREVFLLLISVSGVGPNTALNILSYMTTEEVEHASVIEDKAAFKRVKGIGEKTAAQIVLDLKGKFKVDESMPSLTESAPAAQPFAEDAVSGLIGLGFNKTDARKFIVAAIGDGCVTLEDSIKYALKASK